MGRGKNSNKMYISMKEWTEQFGGKKEGESRGPGFKPLPFDCCAISLQSFEDPVCTEDANVYDIVYVFIFNSYYYFFDGSFYHSFLYLIIMICVLLKFSINHNT